MNNEQVSAVSYGPPSKLTRAELMAMQSGAGVARLRPDWTDLFAALPRLGRIRASTQNALARVETLGTYPPAKSKEARGPCHSIHFEVNLSFLRSVFVELKRSRSERAITRKIHFFGRDGAAVHTLQLTRSSSVAVFEEIIEAFVCSGEAPESLVDQAPSTWFAAGRLDNRSAARSRISLADMSDWLAQDEAPLTVSLVNAGHRHTHFGLFRRIRNAHGILRLKDCGTEMQISEESLAQAWVKKGSDLDGSTDTLTLFDANGCEGVSIARLKRTVPHMHNPSVERPPAARQSVAA